MKIWISYFNNIRNFTKYQIPVSTAMWDPKWYHNNENDKTKVFIDKRGVINGIRCNKLVLNSTIWEHLMALNKECSRECSQYKDRRTDFCPCMEMYLTQLRLVDFEGIISLFEAIQYKAAEFNHNIEHVFLPFSGDKRILDKYEIVLMVHEKPDRQCAERPVLIKWFKEYGFELKEWSKDNVCDTSNE